MTSGLIVGEPLQQVSLRSAFCALGHPVLVETNSEKFAEVAERLFRSFAVERFMADAPEIVFRVVVSQGRNTPHRFYRNGRLFRETSQFWKLARLLEWQMDIFLWHSERRYALFHAGAIAVGEAGVLIPGSSRAGKSSLTMSLLLRGGRYYSDEVGVVTVESHKLLAFPKPLSSRVPHMFPEVTCWFGPSKREVLEEVDGWTPVWFAHADDIRQGAIATPVPVSHVIFPEPGEGSKPRLEPMGEHETMRRLLRHTVNFELVGRDAFHVLAGIVREARAYRLLRNGMELTADLVLETIT